MKYMVSKTGKKKKTVAVLPHSAVAPKHFYSQKLLA
jgi:hypothetical protein